MRKTILIMALMIPLMVLSVAAVQQTDWLIGLDFEGDLDDYSSWNKEVKKGAGATYNNSHSTEGTQSMRFAGEGASTWVNITWILGDLGATDICFATNTYNLEDDADAIMFSSGSGIVSYSNIQVIGDKPLKYQCQYPSTSQTIESSTDHNLQQWYNIIYCVAPTIDRFWAYLDGSLIVNQSLTMAGLPPTDATGVVLGSANTAAGGAIDTNAGWLGNLDDFCIINITSSDLTESEKTMINESGCKSLYNDLDVTFDVNLRDKYDNSVINGNVTLSNSTYSNKTASTGGTVTFIAKQGIYNVTVEAENFETAIFVDYNVTTDLTANLTFYKARFNAEQKFREAFGGTVINNLNLSFYNKNTSIYEYNVTITTGNVTANVTWNNTFNLTLASAGYGTKYFEFNTNDMTDYTLTENLTFYTRNSFYFTFIDELTDLVVDNATLQLISDTFAENYTTGNGTLYLDLLTPTLYTLRFDSPIGSYGERFYYYNLTSNSFTNLTLYLVNGSASSITITVYDEGADETEDVYIKVLKYDLPSNSYIPREIIKTDFAGKAVANIVKNSEFYKFMLYYPFSVLRKTTSPAYITSDSLSLTINIEGGSLADYYAAEDVISSLTYNNATNNFRFTYSDTQAQVTSGRLDVYKTTTSGRTLYDTFSLLADSGTILVSAPAANGTTYEAVGYVIINSADQLKEKASIIFDTEQVGGDTGLLLVAFLTILFAMTGAYSVPLALIITPLPMIFANTINLVDISYFVSIPIEILFIISAIIISRRQL